MLPGPHVSFDVARTRIGDETMRLRIAIKVAIRDAVKDLGIWERLPEELRRTLLVRETTDPFGLGMAGLRRRTELVLDESLLSRVAARLPRDAWPVSVHRQLASELGISNSSAFHAISTLILEGRVTNPNLSSRQGDGHG